MPEAKDYPYDEYSQQQEGTYTLSGTLVPLPLTPVFAVSSNGPAVPLTGSTGTAEIPNVDCFYSMPLATGGTKVVQTVHLDYTISGTTIHLKNRPAEGNYSIILFAQAHDAKGQAIADANGNLQTFEWAECEGDHLDIDGGYTADVQTCGALLSQWVQRIAADYKIYQKVPVWVEVNYPAPDKLLAYIQNIQALGIPEADDILRSTKIAHGNSFNRAILSPGVSSNVGIAGKVGAGKGGIAGKT